MNAFTLKYEANKLRALINFLAVLHFHKKSWGWRIGLNGILRDEVLLLFSITEK
jgi:hypothetical protein